MTAGGVRGGISPDPACGPVWGLRARAAGKGGGSDPRPLSWPASLPPSLPAGAGGQRSLLLSPLWTPKSCLHVCANCIPANVTASRPPGALSTALRC